MGKVIVVAVSCMSLAAAPTATGLVTSEAGLEAGAGEAVISTGMHAAPSTSGTYHVVSNRVAIIAANLPSAVTPLAASSPPEPRAALPSCSTAPLRVPRSSGVHGRGTVHYFCSNGGNDSHDGLSPSTPKASWGAAVSTFGSMPAGDTVALCRGGSWTVSTTNASPSASCTASNTCDFRDYGTGARPIINFTAGGSPTNLFSLQSRSGVRFWNLDIRLIDGSGGGQQAWGLTYGVTDVDICNVAVSGGLHHFDQEYGSGLARCGRVTIRNSTFAHAIHHSILASFSDFTIDSNVFLNNGTSATCPQGSFFCHTIYITDESPGGAGEATTMETQNIHITNNSMTLDSSHTCGSAMIHFGGRHNNMLIENNLVSAAVNAPSGSGSCTGIGGGENNYSKQVSGGLSSWQRHLEIRRNRISLPDPGNQGQVPITVDGMGTTARCGSVAVGQPCPGQSAYKAGDPVTPSVISDNTILVKNDSAIRVLAHTNPATNPGDLTSGVIVYNNSLYVFNPAGAANTINIDNEGSGYVAQNNAVYIANNDSAQCIGAPSGGSPFFLRNSNNYCRTGKKGGLGQMTGTWDTSTSLGSIWTNAPAGDFTLPAGSPLIGAGHPTHHSPTAIGTAAWSATDPGATRAATAVSIGAFARRTPGNTK
jgi:hypothetical protein